VAVSGPDLIGCERLDHLLLGGHAPDPVIGLDAHLMNLDVTLWRAIERAILPAGHEPAAAG
jgi:hypothetical protein